MAKILIKKHPASLVETPQLHKVNMFIDSADNHWKLKFDDGSVETLVFESELEAGLIPELSFHTNAGAFPVTGDALTLYIDRANDDIYRWDSNTAAYKNLSGDAGTISYVRNQFSFQFNKTINVTTVEEVLDEIAFPYTAAAISLTSNPSASMILEKGDTVASVILDATTTKKSEDISSVAFYRGVTLIHTESSPDPDGGIESYTESTAVTSDTTFTAKVNDGTSIVTSNEASFVFVYPYYYGVGTVSLTAGQIQALTKDIKEQSDTEVISSPSSQIFYFAYPESYPALTSILDKNGLEMIDDFSVVVLAFTMLDSAVVNYRVYKYNNRTTQTDFKITYKY